MDKDVVVINDRLIGVLYLAMFIVCTCRWCMADWLQSLGSATW